MRSTDTKHSQGQKVKGQGHKVMRRSSTKTSNISRKCHLVIEIHLSYRKSRRSENMPKTRLRCCQIATILVLLEEIVVAEHDGEGSF